MLVSEQELLQAAASLGPTVRDAVKDTLEQIRRKRAQEAPKPEQPR